MRSPLSTLLQDRLVGSSLLLLFLTTFANIANYLFQVLMGRLLGPEDFGTLSALLSLVMIVAIPMGGLQAAVAHHVAAARSGADLSGLLRTARAFALAAGAIVLAIVTLLAVPVGGRLDATAPAMVLTGLVLALVPPVTFWTGHLQGVERFLDFGIVSALGSAVRVGGAVGLVLCGLSVEGALLGTALGFAVGLAYAGLRAPRVGTGAVSGRHLRPILLYAAPSFLALAGFAALTYVDQVLVKLLFEPVSAGHYAGAAVLGRAILFVSVAVGLVLFPMASREAPATRGRLLRRSLLVGSALTALALLVVQSVPDLLIRWMIGPDFLPSVPVLRVYSLAMALLGLSNLLVFYLLAARRFMVALVLPLLALAEVAAIWAWHGTIVGVASIVLALAAVGFAVLFGLAVLAGRPMKVST